MDETSRARARRPRATLAVCIVLLAAAAAPSARADTITVRAGAATVGEPVDLNASGTVNREESVGVDIFVFPGHTRACPTGHRDEQPYFADPHEEPLIGSFNGPGAYSLDARWTPRAAGPHRLCGLVHSLENQQQGYAWTTHDIVVADPAADIVAQEVSDEQDVEAGEVFQYVTEVTNAGPGEATEATFADEVAGNGTALSASTSRGQCTVANGEQVRCALGTLAVGETARVAVTVRAASDDPQDGVEAEDPDPFAGEDPDPFAGEDDATAEPTGEAAWPAGARAASARAEAAAATTRPSHVKHRSRARARQVDPDPSNNRAGRANQVTPCEASLTIGPVRAAAGCFRYDRKKRIWVSRGAVRVNGIDLVGAAGGPIKILVDPGSGKLFSKGRVDVRLGEVTVYRGPFTLQMQGRGLKLLSQAALKLKGLGIKNIAASWTPGNGAKIDVALSLPKLLGGVSGATSLRATMAAGVSIASIAVEAKKAEVGRLELHDLSVKYDGASRRWTGRVRAELPSPRAPEIKARIEFTGTRLKRLDLEGTFPTPGLPMGTAFFLQRLYAGVRLDPFSLRGTINVTAGPKVLNRAAARLEGKFKFTPPRYRLTGNLEIVGGTLSGTGYVEYVTTGSINLGGRLSFSRGGVGVEGKMKGWIDGKKAFNLAGKASVAMPGRTIRGRGLVSDRGVAACGRTKIFGRKLQVGFGYRWGEKPDIMGRSCDVGPWESRGRSVARAARAGDVLEQVTLPAGLPVAAFAATGEGAPPSVTLVGPGGERVETPADPPAGVETEQFLLAANAEDATTYIAVADPAPGTWRLLAQEGSAPVTLVRQADGLPDPAVRATVTGRGSTRRLAWAATAIPGQRLQFFERSAGATRLLTETASARGAIRFRPAARARGRRSIVVVVVQDGLARATLSVAGYRVR